MYLVLKGDYKSAVGSVNLKNIHNLKLGVMIYLVGVFRTSSPRDSISSDPERSAPRRRGEELVILQQMANSLNIERLFLIKEIQIIQV